jgi:diguanylate cyclase (GGDEF)-like protein
MNRISEHLDYRIRQPGMLFLIFSMIGSVFAIGLLTVIYQTECAHWLTERKTHERYHLQQPIMAINNQLAMIVDDLLFLGHQNALLAYLDSPNQQTEQALQAEYVAWSLAKPLYDQIRYIDAQGMERLRVDHHGTLIPKEAHQDKSQRYYFSETVKLAKDEIFVSPLDLNIEHGTIELPIKPMIRFGIPVYDSTDHKRGIIILNYRADQLLKFITAQQTELNHSLQLVNADGYWLSHPETQLTWGFMFKERAMRSFAVMYPDEWHLIQEQTSGQIRTQHGLFTFATIYPLSKNHTSPSKAGESDPANTNQLHSGIRHWIVISQIPAQILTDQAYATISRLMIIGSGLLLLVLITAWALTAVITNRRAYKAQLVSLALYDSLTGLANRTLFLDRLDQEISHAARHQHTLAVLYIDLDGFKSINDTLGHQAGDELLIRVGEALKKILRKADIVARLGGDEFAVILSKIKEPVEAQEVKAKIAATLSQPFTLMAGIARIGASVGIALFPNDGKTVATLIKHADTKMYQTKHHRAGSTKHT